ncbi:hypothetical protein C5S42_04275 [Candidatus Methanomarinus sp.]|nr:hypothetical protein C5S42_04275 [ANME-2 cluster archaeon]
MYRLTLFFAFGEVDIMEEKEQHIDESIIPPGTYRIDEEGKFHQAIDWQPILGQIKWDEAHKIIENWGKRGTSERMTNLIGMYILTFITIIIAGILAFYGILEGQAIAGFLGAAIGYLLSRAYIKE